MKEGKWRRVPCEVAALRAELEQVKQERDEARKDLKQFTAERTTAEIREDVINAATVGPMVRMIYGDNAELGHYKLAITAFKKGKEGTILLIGQLGRAKIRAEAAESRELRLREALEKAVAGMVAVESLVEFYTKREMNAPANNQEAVRDARENEATFAKGLAVARQALGGK